MAAIQGIRKHGKLLIAVIGIALLAFITEEFFRATEAQRNQNSGVVGTVNGKKIHSQEYSQLIEAYKSYIQMTQGKTTFTDDEDAALKEQVWQSFVTNKLIEAEASKLGLTVTDQEMRNVLAEGNNPMLAQSPFVNQQTGRFDAAMLKNFLDEYKKMQAGNSQVPEQYREQYDKIYSYWQFVEKTLKETILQQKYNALLQMSVTSNPVEGKMAYDATATSKDLILAAVPYTSINDNEVKVSDEELKAKFLAGECAEEELLLIRDWLKDFPEEQKELFKTEKMSDELKAQFMPKSQIRMAEERLQARIRKQEAEQEAEQQTEHHARVVSMWRRAAAVAVVCVLGGLAWFYLQHNSLRSMQMQVVMTGADNDTTLMLPDGTKVWLNRQSALKYPKEFDAEDRVVEIEGEGYFEVTKDPHQPFIVESDVMSVKVLGTVFNFHVDKEQQKASVSLLEGKVRVAGNNDEGTIELEPGQKAFVDARMGSMTVSEADVYQEAMWHEHKTAFSNANINSIAKLLENIYKVQVVVDPAIDQNNTYSGVVKEKETIDSVLDLLQNTLPIHYKVKGNKVYLIK